MLCYFLLTGPSSEMERHGMKLLYERSDKYNLVYKYLIGDGDTKSFCDVWDHYDLCDECNR